MAATASISAAPLGSKNSASLVTFPPEAASLCKFPPLCSILLCSPSPCDGEASVTLGRVQQIALDISSASRENLYTIQTTTGTILECIPERSLQFAPCCPVWYGKEKLPGVVLGSAHPPDAIDKCLYSIKVEGSLHHGVTRDDLLFRDVGKKPTADNDDLTSNRKRKSQEDRNESQVKLIVPAWMDGEAVHDLLVDFIRDQKETKNVQVSLTGAEDRLEDHTKETHILITANDEQEASNAALKAQDILAQSLDKSHRQKFLAEIQFLRKSSKLVASLGAAKKTSEAASSARVDNTGGKQGRVSLSPLGQEVAAARPADPLPPVTPSAGPGNNVTTGRSPQRLFVPSDTMSATGSQPAPPAKMPQSHKSHNAENREYSRGSAATKKVNRNHPDSEGRGKRAHEDIPTTVSYPTPNSSLCSYDDDRNSNRRRNNRRNPGGDESTNTRNEERSSRYSRDDTDHLRDEPHALRSSRPAQRVSARSRSSPAVVSFPAWAFDMETIDWTMIEYCKRSKQSISKNFGCTLTVLRQQGCRVNSQNPDLILKARTPVENFLLKQADEKYHLRLMYHFTLERMDIDTDDGNYHVVRGRLPPVSGERLKLEWMTIIPHPNDGTVGRLIGVKGSRIRGLRTSLECAIDIQTTKNEEGINAFVVIHGRSKRDVETAARTIVEWIEEDLP